MAIDNDRSVTSILIEEAMQILNNNMDILPFPSDDDYQTFTMKIDKDFKKTIKRFCLKKNIRIKDFWNEAAVMSLQKYQR